MSFEQLSQKTTAEIQKLLLLHQTNQAQHAARVDEFEEECQAKKRKLDEIVSLDLVNSRLQARKIVEDACAEADQMRSEIEQWKVEKALIAQTQAFDSTVDLNIGGSQFTTTLTTLRMFPDSMLGAMFSGRHALHKNSNGQFFIDRDGTHFRHILNFLRDPRKFVVNLSSAHRDELRREAEFYCLSELMFPEPVFVKPSEEKRVIDSTDYECTIGQTHTGLWYVRSHVNGNIKEIVRVCNGCGIGGFNTDASGHSNANISNFVGGRVVLSSQPRFNSTLLCVACCKF